MAEFQPKQHTVNTVGDLHRCRYCGVFPGQHHHPACGSLAANKDKPLTDNELNKITEEQKKGRNYDLSIKLEAI